MPGGDIATTYLRAILPVELGRRTLIICRNLKACRAINRPLSSHPMIRHVREQETNMGYWHSRSGTTLSIGMIALPVLLSLLAPLAGHAQSRNTAFQFGVLGDIPYTKVQEQEYRRVLEALNRTDLAFVVHIGDFEQDARRYDPALHSMPCVDENVKTILDSFQSFQGIRSSSRPAITTGPIVTSCRRPRLIHSRPWQRFAQCSSPRDAASASAPFL